MHNNAIFKIQQSFKLIFMMNYNRLRFMETENTGTRITWVDTARGIGIFLVILAHVPVKDFYGFSIVRWIYIFHMPLFFFLAGLTHKKAELNVTAKKSFRQLVIPYIVLYVITCIFWILKSYFVHPEKFQTAVQVLKIIREDFLGMIFVTGLNTRYSVHENPVLWFLICLFWCKIIHSIFYRKNNEDNIKANICVTAIFLTIAFVIRKLNIPSFTKILVDDDVSKVANNFIPLSIGSITLAYPFFYTGTLLKEKFFKNDTEEKKSSIAIKTFLFFTLTTLFYCINKDNININHNRYGCDLLLFLLGGFCGILFMKNLSHLLCVINKPVGFFGANSLSVLAFHGITAYIVHKYSHSLHINLGSIFIDDSFSILTGVIFSFCSLLLCAIPAYLIKRFCPWMIGQRKK